MPRVGVEVDQFLQALPADLNVSPATGIPSVRSQCPKCKKSRLWFCCECMLVLGDKDAVPDVKLPVDVEIVHHPTEKISKSTAPHSVLVSSQVNLVEFPDEVPAYDKDRTLLLYPSSESSSLTDIDLKDFDKVVFIDCTWTQAAGIMAHPHMQGLKHVKIESEKTAFWRTQRVCGDHLATAEAVFYFFKQYHAHKSGSYDGRYDDLLFYFAHLHKKFIATQRERIDAYKQTDIYRERKAKQEANAQTAPEEIAKRARLLAAVDPKRGGRGRAKRRRKQQADKQGDADAEGSGGERGAEGDGGGVEVQGEAQSSSAVPSGENGSQ